MLKRLYYGSGKWSDNVITDRLHAVTSDTLWLRFERMYLVHMPWKNRRLTRLFHFTTKGRRRNVENA